MGNCKEAVKVGDDEQRCHQQALSFEQVVMRQDERDVSLPVVGALEGIVGRAAARRLGARFYSVGALLDVVRDDCLELDRKTEPDLIRIQRAFRMITALARTELGERTVLSSPERVREYLLNELALRQAEVFWMLFLDNQNRLIQSREMFRGTLSQTAVYPREIIRKALELNACAVILAHNHPSGVCEPSHADRLLTDALKAALATLEVRVLDHLIIGAGGQTMSFAEQGLL